MHRLETEKGRVELVEDWGRRVLEREKVSDARLEAAVAEVRTEVLGEAKRLCDAAAAAQQQDSAAQLLDEERGADFYRTQEVKLAAFLQRQQEAAQLQLQTLLEERLREHDRIAIERTSNQAVVDGAQVQQHPSCSAGTSSSSRGTTTSTPPGGDPGGGVDEELLCEKIKLRLLRPELEENRSEFETMMHDFHENISLKMDDVTANLLSHCEQRIQDCSQRTESGFAAALEQLKQEQHAALLSCKRPVVGEDQAADAAAADETKQRAAEQISQLEARYQQEINRDEAPVSSS